MLTDLSGSSLALLSQAAVLTPASHSQPSELQVQALLQSHTFRELFIETLGWDRASNRHVVRLDGHEFILNAVAQKRGFQVFSAAVDRYTIINRHRLRSIQKRLAPLAHEHILIYTSEQPNRQVWQWGYRGSDGHRHRHLEHPFLSHSPPPQLLSRLRQLQITFEDEDTLTLIDAIDRVRSVLETEAEFNLFARSPRLAQRSDMLARAMRTGGTKEFQDFITFHLRLIRRFAKDLHRIFHLDQDEAEQLCALGVMKAARAFDVDRGYQFSTYASTSTRRTTRMLAAGLRLPIRLPAYVLSHCFAMRRLLHQELVAGGPGQARDAVERELDGVGRTFVQAWQAYYAMMERETLSERGSPARRAVRQRLASKSDPSLPLVRREMLDQIRALVDNLTPRDRKVVRLYYGFDGEPLTLKEIGNRLHLTRERIRQILNDNYARLKDRLDIVPEDLQALL